MRSMGEVSGTISGDCRWESPSPSHRFTVNNINRLKTHPPDFSRIFLLFMSRNYITTHEFEVTLADALRFLIAFV
jgi:hypothetical protein